MPLRRSFFVALVSVVLLPPVGLAQNVSAPPPQVRPGWYARTHFIRDIGAADRAILDRDLTAAERLLTSNTGYDRPRGFEVRPHWINTRRLVDSRP